MKYLLLGAIFFGIPFALLNWAVMPQLEQLKTTYSQLDKTAEQAVSGSSMSLQR